MIGKWRRKMKRKENKRKGKKIYNKKKHQILFWA